jgi:hypothetical protein
MMRFINNILGRGVAPADLRVTFAELKNVASEIDNRDIFAAMIPDKGVGIELGVASAGFSCRLLGKNDTLFLYGADMYAGDRGHDTAQYKVALTSLKMFRERSCLIRARFDEIVDMFDDDFFDFVYIDGYAHTGEEGGTTFRDWLPKVKPFGVLAGDDYHPDWPLVVREVDTFLSRNKLPLFTIANSWNPTIEWQQWFTIKGPTGDERYQRTINSITNRIASCGASAGCPQRGRGG